MMFTKRIMRSLLVMGMFSGMGLLSPISVATSQSSLQLASFSHPERPRSGKNQELEEIEQALAANQKDLLATQQVKLALEQELKRLDGEKKQLDAQLERHRQRLAQNLYLTYIQGYQAGAQHLLSGSNPNELARDAYYLRAMAHARNDAIDVMREDQMRLLNLIALQEGKRVQLSTLEQELLHKQRTLATQRTKRLEMLGGERRSAARFQVFS